MSLSVSDEAVNLSFGYFTCKMYDWLKFQTARQAIFPDFLNFFSFDHFQKHPLDSSDFKNFSEVFRKIQVVADQLLAFIHDN